MAAAGSASPPSPAPPPSPSSIIEEDSFGGFNKEDGAISLSLAKKRRIHEIIEPEPTLALIVRKDKKQIPFNFINNVSSSWELLKTIDYKSLTRISKGTVIKSTILPNKIESFNKGAKNITFQGVEYEAYSPRQYTPYLGELYLDLSDIDDKSILTMNDLELTNSIKPPGDPESNSILTVDRIYPKKQSSQRDTHKYNSCRISIQFSSHIPNRVYFQNVSIPITPYTLPPKRCFTCQRWGHSSISCKRKTICPICAEGHTSDNCQVTDKANYKCAACGNNHKAFSTTCEYYKQALAISAELQGKNINQEQANKYYVKLYENSPNEKSPSQPRSLLSKGIVFDSQPLPSVSDFPPISPSPIIRTNLDKQASITKSKQSTSKDKGQSLPSSSSQSSLNLSQLFPSQQEQNPDPPLSQALEDSQFISSVDSYITPAQKPKKQKQPRPTPFHCTSTYSDVLNGSLWHLPETVVQHQTQQNDESHNDESHNDESHRGTGNLNAPNTSVRQRNQPESDTSSLLFKSIESFLQDTLQKIITWITDKIKSFLGKDGLSNILQNLLSSFISSSN